MYMCMYCDRITKEKFKYLYLNTFKNRKSLWRRMNGLKYLPVHFDVWLDQRFLDMGDLFASED